jgi:glycerol-3-phosphate acyltransferase PlsY
MYIFNGELIIVGFTLLMALFVIYRHRPNINRLLAGEENKVSLKLTPDENPGEDK